VVEPGEVELFVGTSSEKLAPAGTVTIVPDPARPPVKAFQGTVTLA
jgi:hypothetical protein